MTSTTNRGSATKKTRSVRFDSYGCKADLPEQACPFVMEDSDDEGEVASACRLDGGLLPKKGTPTWCPLRMSSVTVTLKLRKR